MNFLRKNLFDFETKETAGEIIFFKLFELFVIFYTIQLAWSWGFYILRISDVVLPLGVANYIDVSFMFGNSLPLVNAALITVICILGYFRVGTRWLYAVALLLLHFQYATRFCIGEIAHSSNFIGMALMGFALGVGLFQNRRQQIRFTLGFVLFFVGFGYTTSAMCKIIGSGIHWVDGRHLWLWIAEKGTDHLSKTGSYEMNWLQKLAFTNHLAATGILLIGWLAEVFGFLFWFKKTRPFIAVGAICLHIGIHLTMNIFFAVFIYEVILIGFPWATLLDKIIPQDKIEPALNKWLRFGV